MRVSAPSIGVDAEIASWPELSRDAIPAAPGFGSTLEETVRAARGWSEDPSGNGGGAGGEQRDAASHPSEDDLLTELLLFPSGASQGFAIAGDPSVDDDLDEKALAEGAGPDLEGMLRSAVAGAVAGAAAAGDAKLDGAGGVSPAIPGGQGGGRFGSADLGPGSDPGRRDSIDDRIGAARASVGSEPLATRASASGILPSATEPGRVPGIRGDGDAPDASTASDSASTGAPGGAAADAGSRASGSASAEVPGLERPAVDPVPVPGAGGPARASRARASERARADRPETTAASPHGRGRAGDRGQVPGGDRGEEPGPNRGTHSGDAPAAAPARGPASGSRAEERSVEAESLVRRYGVRGLEIASSAIGPGRASSSWRRAAAPESAATQSVETPVGDPPDLEQPVGGRAIGGTADPAEPASAGARHGEAVVARLQGAGPRVDARSAASARAMPDASPARSGAVLAAEDAAAGARRALTGAGRTGQTDAPSVEALDGSGPVAPATAPEHLSPSPSDAGVDPREEAAAPPGNGRGSGLGDGGDGGTPGRGRADDAARSSRRGDRRTDPGGDGAPAETSLAEDGAGPRPAGILLRREIAPPLARAPLAPAEPGVGSPVQTGAAAGAPLGGENPPTPRATLAASILPESNGLPSWAERIAGALERENLPARTELRIALDPEGLGRLDIRLRLQDGALHAQVVADHEQTRGLLVQQQHVLEAALQKNDLRLLQLDVGLRGDGQARQSPFGEPETPLGWPGDLQPERDATPIATPMSAPSRGRLSVHA